MLFFINIGKSFHILLNFHIQLIIMCFQAVHIQIIDFTPEIHHRWTDKETPEELIEDAKAIKEEQEMNDRLKQTPPHRRISGPCPIVQESPDEGPPTCNDV